MGQHRMVSLSRAPWLNYVGHIYTSTERKAQMAGDILCERLGIESTARADMGENDRSATGFLPGAEFEAMADAFFAEPDMSVRGWERAVDAQDRIVKAAVDVIAKAPKGDILCIGHGAVGTLLYCHYAELPISRVYDQKRGGCIWQMTLPDMKVRHGWRMAEEMTAISTL